MGMGMGTLHGAMLEVGAGDMWHLEGHDEDTEVGQHQQSWGWLLGAGWCQDPAGSQLGPGWLPRASRGAQPAAAFPAGYLSVAVPPRHGTGGTQPGPPLLAGPHPPLEGLSHPGPEQRSQLRRLPASGGGGRRGPRCQMEPAPRCNISGR